MALGGRSGAGGRAEIEEGNKGRREEEGLWRGGGDR